MFGKAPMFPASSFERRAVAQKVRTAAAAAGAAAGLLRWTTRRKCGAMVDADREAMAGMA